MKGAMHGRLVGRRELLEGALASLALPFLAGACSDDDARDAVDAGPDIRLEDDAGAPRELPASVSQYFSDAERAAILAIGEAHLGALDGDEASLEDTLDAAERLDAEGLGERVAQDFEDGRVALVEGWVLSRTEADLCALLALLS